LILLWFLRAAARSLFGGANDAGGVLDDTWEWDGKAKTWTWKGGNWIQQFPAAAPSARTLQMMAYDLNLGEVVLFGGTFAPPRV
jgi:hypothetical protein